MAVDLLKHNEITYEKISGALASGARKLAISHATGTGKSYLITKLFEDYNEEKKLVLVPSTYIKEQIQKIFEKYDIVNADIMLYQKLIKLEDEEIVNMDYGVVALDEFHHDTSKVWGGKVRKLIGSHPDSIIFGTTATPIRSDGINALDELFEGNCVSELLLSTAIAKKVVPIPVYVSALYTLDDELERLRDKVKNATNTDEEKKELYQKIDSMRKQIEKSYGVPIILNKHIKDKEGKYLVFCKNKKHLAEIKDIVMEWFRIAGFKDIHSYVVHSTYEGKDKEYKAFCDDISHNLKLLFCVNMLNEGLHLENISGVLLLRPTNSNIIWHQQIGRCIESNNSKNPVIIDAVNNFNSVQQGIGLLQEIKEAVVKEKEGGNKGNRDSDFMDIDTFFVTEYIQDVREMFSQIEGRLKDSWDLYIRALKQYKEREGDCLVPRKHIEVFEDGTRMNLGEWVRNVRISRNGNLNYNLTDVRLNHLSQLGFVWNIDKMGKIDKFCEYALLYKEKYGHTNIKCGEKIDKYNIGSSYNHLCQDYRNDRLTNEEIEKIKDIGINIFVEYKIDRQFNENKKLVQQAVNEGVIITKKNCMYKGVNLYNWYQNHKKQFTDKELEVILQLIPKREKEVKIIDMKSGESKTYKSINEAGRALHNIFHVVKRSGTGACVIHNHLTGKVKNPIYKNRFKFEYGEETS